MVRRRRLPSSNALGSLDGPARSTGVEVPDPLIAELENAESRVAASVSMAGRIVRDVAPMCRGIHIMAIGWEHRIAAVMEAAGF